MDELGPEGEEGHLLDRVRRDGIDLRVVEVDGVATGEAQTLGDEVDTGNDARADIGNVVHNVGFAVDETTDRGTAAGVVDELVAACEFDRHGHEDVNRVVHDADDGGRDAASNWNVETGSRATSLPSTVALIVVLLTEIAIVTPSVPS